MERLNDVLLAEMARLLKKDERDEMAIPSYLHTNPLLRWMAWHRVEVVAGYMAKIAAAIERPPAKCAVMDYGCGTGILFPEEAKHFGTIYGVDIVLMAAQHHLQEREYPNTSIQLCLPPDAHMMIPDHSLDMIIAAEVLEHLSPLDDTLDFYWQKLRPDGHLIITVPTENRLYQFGRKLSGFDKHFHVDNAASIHKTINSHRFQSLYIQKIPLINPFDIYWLIDYRPS